VNAAASRGTTIAGNASANVEGAWTQLSAATPVDACGLWITIGQPFTIGTVDFLVDIGVGAAGDEQIIVENLLYSVGSFPAAPDWGLFLPRCIAAGSRVAARAQCSGATNRQIGLMIHLIPGVVRPMQRCESGGADTSDSGGTLIDPGAGAAHVKGAWVQMIASTTFPYRALAMLLGFNKNGTATVQVEHAYDIGVGAAGDEQVIIANLRAVQGSGDDLVAPMAFGAYPVNIPAGSRIAVRAQCSITGADRLTDAMIVGIGP